MNKIIFGRARVSRFCITNSTTTKMPSFTDLHIEFLFTLPDRLVFGDRLVFEVGDWPVLFNLRVCH